jgi:hypothetical protein
MCILCEIYRMYFKKKKKKKKSRHLCIFRYSDFAECFTNEKFLEVVIT